MQWAACSVYFGTGPCSIFATHLSKLQMHALGLPPYLWLGPNWPCSFSMPSPHANWFSVTHLSFLWLLKLPGPHHPRATKFSRKQKAKQAKNNEHRNLSMLSLLHTSMIFFFTMKRSIYSCYECTRSVIKLWSGDCTGQLCKTVCPKVSVLCMLKSGINDCNFGAHSQSQANLSAVSVE